ncbi:protein SAWADEE HOMEODOMAIN-like protein 1-like isoform X2 [Cucumis melo var. makuwa]|uniref:Protein SAWADEE HOMEODOMAIN-like protein 1-like isoform X2 n=1 Tax=Cucumis melo var. makuwa TaxID=1194695 RepID=A0A5D3E5J8_CUCMM|nr:protein SAWADEE HOMEODOMAIN-like protein 1-like isoform X2 [Cucumis melo var. makuwa]
MERLRPRGRQMFSGFTKGEIEKMEKLLEESGEQSLNRDFCQKVTKRFKIRGRVLQSLDARLVATLFFKLKPIAQSFSSLCCEFGVQIWFRVPPEEMLMGLGLESCTIESPLITTVYDWLQSRLQDLPKIEKRMSEIPKACPSNKTQESSQGPEGEKSPDLSELEFEARSSKDGAWYDVAMFLTHRFLSSGEAEVRVRFVGFGAEEDEWVNIKQAVRERSVPLEHSECQKVKAGDLVLCFQERRDQAIYYDAHIVEVQRRMHDIRGCRCLFLVRYDHDSTEASHFSYALSTP